MKPVLDYLWAAITVLCLGSKALNEIRGPRTGPARNLSSTRRGWGYIPGNR